MHWENEMMKRVKPLFIVQQVVVNVIILKHIVLELVKHKKNIEDLN